jgi:hypothetical protein
MSGAVVAVILGSSLNNDVNRSYEGSELLETNY